MTHYTSVLLFTAVLLLSACTKYLPKPLYPEQEWRQLQDVRLDDLLANAKDLLVDRNQLALAFNYADGISADEAAGLAVVLNLDLRVIRLAKEIAQGQLLAAGLLPNPDIDGRWLTPVSGGSRVFTEIDIFFDLTEALLIRGPSIDRAEIRIEEINWELVGREWEIANEVRRAFSDVLYWDRTIELNKQQQQVTKQILEITNTQYDLDAGTELDVVLAESESVELERRARQLNGQRKQAIQKLNRLIGLPPNHPTQLQKSEKPLAYIPLSGDVDRFADKLRIQRPDLRQAEQAYLGSEKELQIAIRKQYPRLRLGPSYEHGEGKNLVGGGLSLEIPVFNLNQGEIAVRMAERDQMHQAYVAILHQARGRLYDTWSRLETLNDELGFYFSDVAPRLERSLDLTEQAFKAGQLDILRVLLVQNRVLDSKRQILEALRGYHRSRIDLIEIIGPVLNTKPTEVEK
ncbi:MAG: TolC family protein [Gammaproteobacteria bacterium]